jgi:hypothetical protein
MSRIASLALLLATLTADAAPCARALPAKLPQVACPTSLAIVPCLRCLRGQSTYDLTYDLAASALTERWHTALDAAGWKTQLTAFPSSEPPGPGGRVAAITATRGKDSVSITVAIGKDPRSSSTAKLTLLAPD